MPAAVVWFELQFNVSGPSPKTYGMCFGSPADWNKFGNPGTALVLAQLCLQCTPWQMYAMPGHHIPVRQAPSAKSVCLH